MHLALPDELFLRRKSLALGRFPSAFIAEAGEELLGFGQPLERPLQLVTEEDVELLLVGGGGSSSRGRTSTRSYWEDWRGWT